MTARRCEHCAETFVPRRRPTARDPQRFCSVACRNDFRRRAPRTCPVCGVSFVPNHSSQQACDRVCGSMHGARKRKTDTMAIARRERAKAYAQRLSERLASMSKSAIWRLAYTRGWQACWLKYGKGQRVPKRPAHEVVDACLEAAS